MKDIFLLDMDETLLDFSRAERVNFARTMEKQGVKADETIYERYHAINDSLWKMLERGEITRQELMVRRFGLLIEECGLAASAEAAARDYYEGFPEICFPYDGADRFLKTLSEKGRVYIATNGGAVIQRRHIALADFAPYLSGVFISEEVGADKPSHAYAGYVAAHIGGFDKNRAVFLGDSLTSDRICAERMGVDFVLYAPRGGPERYCGACAHSYAEFLSMI